ncbi:hypothetical protein NUW58_g2182 [Xylaria curta]|uniref:Uncharacterized protein n=1 Tax=Xylaria curta TaxID=42375 RepID=A0ACC1PJD8_9PEZI|nr:hypothetical protein NUW58_g2182 [Xylaria curta]
MMGDIYADARTVLIWLGPGDDSTPRVFRRFRVIDHLYQWVDAGTVTRNVALPILKRLHFSPEGAVHSFSYSLMSVLTLMVTVNSKNWKKYGEGLRSLFRHPWFVRAWTMQEVAFARECFLLCGSVRIRWDVFMGGLRGIDNTIFENEVVRELITCRSVARTYLTNYPRVSPLRRRDIQPELRLLYDRLDDMWLESIGYLKSTLPQDRIYGLYSVFKTTGLELPNVDYQKSIAGVYGDITKAFIGARDLSILLFSIRPRGFDDLPTWTPDWDRFRTEEGSIEPIETTIIYSQVDAFRASGDSITRTPDFYPPGELKVRGVIVGSAQSIIFSSTREPPTLGPDEAKLWGFTQACRDWCQESNSSQHHELYGDEENCIEARLCTLVFHEVFEGFRRIVDEEHAKTLREDFDMWWDVLKYPNCEILAAGDVESASGSDPATSPLEIILAALDPLETDASTDSDSDSVTEDSRDLLSQASLFHHEYCLELADWVFLSLDTGHIGRAYFNSREGDHVALLAGLKVPYLLRKVAPGRYQAVAPAYIHGMMDGNFWPENESDVEDFVLV